MTGRGRTAVTRRAAVAVALVVCLSLAAAPTASAADPTPEAVCADAQGEGDARSLVVGYLADSGRVLDHGTTASLYPGTRVTIVVCRGGQKKLVKFSGGNGLADVSREGAEFRATFEVQRSAAGATLRVFNETWLDDAPEARGLTVAVPEPTTASGSAGDATLAFATTGAADEYAAAKATFDERMATVENGTARIRAMERAAENGSLALGAANNSSVAAPVAALGDVGSTRADLEARLHRAAWRTGESGHLAEIAALRDRETGAREDLTTALREYRTALQDRRSAAVSSAATDLLVGLAGGLLVGVVGATLYVRRQAGDVAYDRQFTRVGLGRKILLVPVVGAALAVALTLAAVHVLFGLPALVGAIL